MAYENNNDRKQDSAYSKRIKAGKRRTYFFDVRETKSNDYYLTITESRKRFNADGYDRHKIFVYKEDFNKFVNGLNDAVNYIKTDLMPDFDFDAFNHDDNGDYDEGTSRYSNNTNTTEENNSNQQTINTTNNTSVPTNNTNSDDEKW